MKTALRWVITNNRSNIPRLSRFKHEMQRGKQNIEMTKHWREIWNWEISCWMMLISKIECILIIKLHSTFELCYNMLKMYSLKVPTDIILLIVTVLRSPKYSSMIIERIGNRQIEGCCYRSNYSLGNNCNNWKIQDT